MKYSNSVKKMYGGWALVEMKERRTMIEGIFTNLLKGVGTVMGLIGASMIAMCTDCGTLPFMFFLVSSITWGWAAYRMSESSLLILQVAFVIINIIGIYNWS